MDCQIVWTLAARRDLRRIVQHVSRDNIDAAVRLGQDIFEKVEMLRSFPEVGRVVPEQQNPSIREIILRPYRIVYRHRSGTAQVSVLRVWHGARGEPFV
jgi:plasmid stabilization system protein ParE